MGSSIKTNFRFRQGRNLYVYAEFDDDQDSTCQRVLKLLYLDPETTQMRQGKAFAGCLNLRPASLTLEQSPWIQVE